MNRQELRSLLTTIKKQLNNSVKWEDIITKDTEYCSDGEYHSLKKDYNGTITKAELQEALGDYSVSKIVNKSISHDYATIEFDTSRNIIYACILVDYEDRTRFRDRIEVNICTIKVN